MPLGCELLGGCGGADQKERGIARGQAEQEEHQAHDAEHDAVAQAPNEQWPGDERAVVARQRREQHVALDLARQRMQVSSGLMLWRSAPEAKSTVAPRRPADGWQAAARSSVGRSARTIRSGGRENTA